MTNDPRCLGEGPLGTKALRSLAAVLGPGTDHIDVSARICHVARGLIRQSRPQARLLPAFALYNLRSFYLTILITSRCGDSMA